MSRLLMASLLIAGIAAGAASAATRPNILLAISDDQSFPHASAYGSGFVKTPAFDRVAGAGVLFRAAFVASPGCSPSRAALLTGRYPWQLEEAGTHASSFPAKYAVYPELLEKAGYVTGYTGKGWGPGSFKAGGRDRNPAGAAYNSRRHESPEGVSDTDYAANFSDFLKQRPPEAPFCFWFGAQEPHRVFKRGIGLEQGGRLDDVEVPAYLPDTETVRGDLLDYAFEIGWFDRQLGRMLDELEAAGLLENTLVIVTSDNGMAFPRAKANCYEHGVQVPLAIAWPARIPGGRDSRDLVSLIDLAPTILEATGVSHPGEPAMTGQSLLPLLTGAVKQGPRKSLLAGRERHSSSRHQNWTYPQRALRTADHLLVWNLKPDRWPAGDPRKLNDDGTLGPPHGGYHDIDACPTLDELIARRVEPAVAPYFDFAVSKRPEFELFNVSTDPACLTNLAKATSPETGELVVRLKRELRNELLTTGDTRLGPDPDVWERYPRYSPIRQFPAPDREP